MNFNQYRVTFLRQTSPQQQATTSKPLYVRNLFSETEGSRKRKLSESDECTNKRRQLAEEVRHMNNLLDKKACQSERETIVLDGLLATLSRKSQSLKAQTEEENKQLQEKADNVLQRANAVVGVPKEKEVRILNLVFCSSRTSSYFLNISLVAQYDFRMEEWK